ncbi:hypothetical protein SAMN05444156_3021 [Verrucomicrobium sp. GAS474]|nr:hypothetical protein SAMN05444156_3021 [Verrucomicrobium sp. GAS474]
MDLVEEIRRELDSRAIGKGKSVAAGHKWPQGLGEEIERAVWEALRLWDAELALPVCPLTGQVYAGGEWIDLVTYLRDHIAKPLVGKFSDRALLDLVEREMSLYHQHVLVR